MKAYLKKEWLLAVRQIHDLLQPLFFVLILVTLFPLAIGSEERLLQKIAPGITWMAALLSILLACEKCYQSDFEDGSLEQLLLSGRNPLILIGTKAMMLWIMQVLPILLVLPLLGTMYGLTLDMAWQLTISLLIGSPSLLLLGMLGSAVTLPVASGGMLLILVILPLYIPTLIFALSAVSSYADGFSNMGQLAILGAILILTMITVPFAIVGVIKVSLAES